MAQSIHTTAHSPKLDRVPRAPGSAIDLCVDTQGDLVMFLVTSPEATRWAVSGGLKRGVKWLGAYWLDQEEAQAAVGRALHKGFVVSVDGRLVCS
jgi:hypothetical protein